MVMATSRREYVAPLRCSSYTRSQARVCEMESCWRHVRLTDRVLLQKPARALSALLTCVAGLKTGEVDGVQGGPHGKPHTIRLGRVKYASTIVRKWPPIFSDFLAQVSSHVVSKFLLTSAPTQEHTCGIRFQQQCAARHHRGTRLAIRAIHAFR